MLVVSNFSLGVNAAKYVAGCNNDFISCCPMRVAVICFAKACSPCSTYWPEIILLLIQLGYLELRQNLLTGTLPDAWSSLVNLKVLNLRTNNLAGSIPVSYSSLYQATLWPYAAICVAVNAHNVKCVHAYSVKLLTQVVSTVCCWSLWLGLLGMIYAVQYHFNCDALAPPSAGLTMQCQCGAECKNEKQNSISFDVDNHGGS